MTKNKIELSDEQLNAIAKGERGMPPRTGERSRAGVPFAVMPPVPWPSDGGGLGLSGGEEPQIVDTPDRAVIEGWANELAKLSPAAYGRVMDKFGVSEPAEIDDTNLREFGIAIRTALDVARELLKDAVAKNVGRAKR